MDERKRGTLIERYKQGYLALAEALKGITDQQLDARPAPGKWSPREIVHHLADSEMTAAIRLRLLLAVDKPAIQGYDQDRFAQRLFYDRPYETSLQAFKAARDTTAEVLDRMSASDWQREGTHTEVGRYTVERWLEIYSDHAHNHAEQILRARAYANEKRAEE